jgi:hypothetical protein
MSKLANFFNRVVYSPVVQSHKPWLLAAAIFGAGALTSAWSVANDTQGAAAFERCRSENVSCSAAEYKKALNYTQTKEEMLGFGLMTMGLGWAGEKKRSQMQKFEYLNELAQQDIKITKMTKASGL